MSKKDEEIIVGPEDFPAYLHAWMVKHGYSMEDEQERADSIKRFAAYLGVTRELVYMMFKGRAPSRAVREKVGLETVWRVNPEVARRAQTSMKASRKNSPKAKK